jgi:beta-lactam-binding protein with PASTA domain
VVKCVVPRVIGLSLPKAKARIRNHRCSVGRVTKKFSTLKKRGKVLAQAPKAGKHLKRGAKVNLIVGKGPKRRS